MCARYTLVSSPEEVQRTFGYVTDARFPPRSNIAPTQPVAMVRLNGKGTRELALVRWGLIPPWVKDPTHFATIVNARAETAAEKPSFRGALRHHRCLVPASGFYEWSGARGRKQPHLIRPRAGGLFALAGLFEHWQGADGSEIETMAILTVPANSTMAALHNRMPAILDSEQFDNWLDCRSGSASEAVAMLAPASDDRLEIVPVSPKLNDSRYDGPVIEEPAQRALL
jgi:putative SOS response-associated peptidase YedK